MLDQTDLKILRLLQKNARIPNVEIARKLKITPSAIHKRIRRLEEEKVILGYETKVDPSALELGMECYIKVHTDEKPGTVEIGKMIAAMPEVQEVHFMAADFYYLVKVCEKDSKSHAKFIRKLGELGVRDCYTLLILESLKNTFRMEAAEK